jgi:hypothetical protein
LRCLERKRERENQKEVKEVRGLGFNNHNGRLIWTVHGMWSDGQCLNKTVGLVTRHCHVVNVGKKIKRLRANVLFPLWIFLLPWSTTRLLHLWI